MKKMSFLRASVTALWLFTSMGALAALWTYETQPCIKGTTPSRWPIESPLKMKPGTPLLVMSIHPHCPCSEASIEEFTRVVLHAKKPFEAKIIFIKPAIVNEGWEKTEYWKKAEKIPSVEISTDEDGKISALLGAKSSGHVVFYDEHEHLMFSGGITGARGHMGKNPAEDQLMAVINGKSDGNISTPVYGCLLENPNKLTTNTLSNLKSWIRNWL